MRELDLGHGDQLVLCSKFPWLGLWIAASLTLILLDAGWFSRPETPANFELVVKVAVIGFGVLSAIGLVFSLIWTQVLSRSTKVLSVEDSNQLDTWGMKYPACAEYLEQLKHCQRRRMKLDYWALRDWVAANSSQAKVGT